MQYMLLIATSNGLLEQLSEPASIKYVSTSTLITQSAYVSNKQQAVRGFASVGTVRIDRV